MKRGTGGSNPLPSSAESRANLSLGIKTGTLNAFVARWCVGSKIETAGGAFQVREDEPAPRVGARLHRTP